MKKEEFLAALAAEIRDLSKEDIARSLEYYGEMVDERVEGGMSVEEAIADLGGPEGVARQIMEQLPRERTTSDTVRRGVDKFFAAADRGIDALDKSMNALDREMNALGERIGREMDERYGGTVLADEDPGENSGAYNIDEPFQAIDVSVIGADVRILRSSDGKTHIETEHPDSIRESVVVQDGVLVLRHTDDGETGGRSFFGIRFNFSFSGGGRVTLYLADELWEFTRVQSISGEIEAQDLRARNVRLSTKSGDVEARHLRVESRLALESMSGDVEIENVTAGEVLLSSMSGDVETDNTEAGSISMRSKSGDMDLENTLSHGELTVETTSGDVTLRRCDGRDVLLHSTSGDIDGTLLTPKAEFRGRSVSGDVDLPENMSEGVGVCEACTTSGDISLRIAL